MRSLLDMVRRLRWWVKALAVVVALGVVAAVVIPIALRSGFCATGVSKVDDQCIGIADGVDDAVFGTDFADVLGPVQRENARITASGRPFVSVAYTIMKPRPGVDDQFAATERRELIGAHVAQMQANATARDDDPQIRLLVANLGDGAAQWADPSAVPALIARAGKSAPDRLVAVGVSGKSVSPITATIDALLGARIPVITARLTADQLTSSAATADLPLARTAPTNTGEAIAAATYLRPTTRRAMLVQNSDRDDLYSASLGSAFGRAYSDATHSIVTPIESFSARSGVTNTMKGILRSICLQKPDVVYFAGRAPALTTLVEALPLRPCRDLPILIVTGDDAVDFTSAAASSETIRAGLAANATVTYTALAHPDAWKSSPGSFTGESTGALAGTCATCMGALFPGESLDDAAAIIAYDVVLTAHEAVISPDGINDTPDQVGQQFKRMHAQDAVPGASGWMSFAATGEPINKAIALLQVRPTGEVGFVAVTSASGSPCLPDGKAC